MATLLVAAALLAATAAGAVELGDRVIDRRRAQTAADAAALAGVVGGEVAAREFAAANGGDLLRFDRVGDDVIVVVAVDASAATARASTGLTGR